MFVQSEEFKKMVHETRKQIDSNINAVEYLKKMVPQGEPCGRELSLAYTKLQEAKMWCGKALEMAGSELPAEFRDKAGE